MLAATMKRWQEAEQHFENALAMNTRMYARPWLAHTQYNYATMLQARNLPGDHEKAVFLLHEALATAVATHVRNSLAKTSSANRTEAAAYAMRCGMVLE